MVCPPKKMAVVERWSLVEVRQYSVTGAWEKEVCKKKADDVLFS